MSPGYVLLIVVAGILCGAINSIAGGGSLILFPALLATGMSPLVANVTNSVATWPGYAGGLLGFRPDLPSQRARMKPLLAAALIGSTIGCLLLLNTPSGAFDIVVPLLILVAAALLAFQPAIKRMVGEPREGGRVWSVQFPAMIAATVYGGYFGAALGVIILGVLALTVPDTLRRLNALKGVVSFVDCSISVVIFGIFGPVNWLAVLIAAPTTLIGGYLGARMARYVNESALRWSVVSLGVVIAVYLFVKAVAF
ncbi:sulfite exporter TauE/SafE family protein [Nakamurella panacisegetis]|uniref:sulfite exporter TauE/SafE family protein n=1 Tax=Nakamurella panacisegetis TaxID=1090615 RepID=UPI000B88C269|nr:sulfite exporter TauE/SafE family protein [Nakamurella panacisegetis]